MKHLLETSLRHLRQMPSQTTMNAEIVENTLTFLRQLKNCDTRKIVRRRVGIESLKIIDFHGRNIF